MNSRIFQSWLVLVVVALSSASPAKTFVIGGLYAETTTGHFGCTCSREALCVSEGLAQAARRNGEDVRFHNLAPSYVPLSIITAAQTVKNLAYDVAVGATISSDAIVASDIFERAGIPFVTPTATNPRVTQNKLLTVRMAFHDDRQANLLASFASDEVKRGKVVVIRNVSQPYSDFLGLQFTSELRKLRKDIEVIEFKFLDGSSNLPAVVAEGLAARPSLIFAPLYRAELSLIYEQLLQKNSNVVLLASDTIENEPDFSRVNAEERSGPRFYFTKHWDGVLKGPRASEYARFHKRQCPSLPVSMSSIAAFDSLSLILQTHRKSPLLRGQKFADALRVAKYNGVLGELHRDSRGEPIKPIYLFSLTAKGSELAKVLQ